MSLSVHSSPSFPATYSNPLKRKIGGEFEKIQRKIEAIQNSDGLVNEIIEWKVRFSNEIKRNDDLYPVVVKFMQEIAQLLIGSPLLALPVRQIDERHELLEALIAFTRLYIKPMPSELITAAKQIQVLRLATPLTEEKRQRIEQVRARKAAEESERAKRVSAPVTHIHTFSEIALKAEQEVLERMQRIEQLEQQIQTIDVQDLLAMIAALEQGNQDLEVRLGKASRSIPVLDRLLNPFRPVEEGEAAVINIHPEVMNSAMRRRLRAELLVFQHKIQEWGVDDDMSKIIKKWGDDFWESLKLLAPEQSILTGYVKLAQGMLLEPIYGTPFDEEALYGSDGNVYGKMAYELWKSEAKILFRNRSPQNPNDPTRLQLKPHPVVRYMTAWLKSHQSLLVSEDILKAHAEIPLRRQKQIQENKRMMNAHVASFKDAEERDLQMKLDVLQARLDNNHAHLLGLKDKSIAAVMEQIDQSTHNVVEIVREQNKEIEQLEDEIQELNQEVTHLAVGISQNKEGTNQVVQGTQQLAIAIKETEIAIKKMNKKRKMAMVKTAIAIAACAAASWAGAALAPSLGLEGVTVAPITGGATAGATFAS